MRKKKRKRNRVGIIKYYYVDHSITYLKVYDMIIFMVVHRKNDVIK